VKEQECAFDGSSVSVVVFIYAHVESYTYR